MTLQWDYLTKVSHSDSKRQRCFSVRVSPASGLACCLPFTDVAGQSVSRSSSWLAMPQWESHRSSFA